MVESPRGPCSWGPSEARCAPLMRLLLLSDPGSWCSGTRKHLMHLPGLCSAHGGVAGLEQLGEEQHESPRGRCRWGPSGARCAPVVRLLLLSDPGSWCSGTGGGLRQLPGPFPRAVASLGTSRAGRGAALQPPWAAGGWGRRRPGAPLWCGCCSSLTLVLGAAALGAAWGSSPGFSPRAVASLGTSRAGRGAARQPPWAAGGWGRRRPGAPLWCGCCSSLTLVLGAAALGAAWGSSPGFSPRAVASLGTSRAGRGAARQPPWAAGGWSRRRPGAPLWCGCCSSLTLVLGAAALGAAWGSSLDFFPRAASSRMGSWAWSSTRAPRAPVGSSKGGKWVLKPPFFEALLRELAVETGGYCSGGVPC